MLVFCSMVASAECSMNAAEFSQMNADLTKLANAKQTYTKKDSDGDGLVDWYEIQLGMNPYAKDSDLDGIDDKWEVSYGLDPLMALDAGLDKDGDGFSNLDEYKEQTDPTDKNSNFNTKMAAIMVPIISYLLN